MKNYMTLDYFNDWYYLEALKVDIERKISANPALGFSHSVDRLLRDVEEYRQEMTENIGQRVFTYIYAACMGEARHAVDTLARDSFVEELRQQRRSDVFKMAHKYPPTRENVQVLVDVFSTPWRGSFGGNAWKNIALALQMYPVSVAQFLDHVVDLEHNCGTVFSKGEAKEILNFGCSYDGDFPQFLDYKFRRDILTEEIMDLRVTRKTALLVFRHNTIFFKKQITTWLYPKNDPLPPYYINWGTGKLTIVKKWNEWVETRHGNVPTMSIIKRKALHKFDKLTDASKVPAIIAAEAFAHGVPQSSLKSLEKNLKNVAIKNSMKAKVLPVKVMGYDSHFFKIEPITLSSMTYSGYSMKKMFPNTKGKINGHTYMHKGKIHLQTRYGDDRINCRLLSYHLYPSEE